MAVKTRHPDYDLAIARTIVRRVAAGETVRSLWGDPTVPGCRTMRRWRRAQPAFDRALDAAVNLARSRRHLKLSPHGWAIREAIILRLANGEGLKAIARDPAMPSTMTIYDWIHREPEFRDGVAMAREFAIEALADQGEEIALRATIATAQQADAALTRLRWRAGLLAGKTFGLGAQPPPDLPALADPGGYAATIADFLDPLPS